MAVAVASGEPGGDGAAERHADERRSARASPVDQLGEPGEDEVGARRAAGDRRRAEARQVRDQETVRGHEPGHDGEPHPRPATLPVQEDDRVTLAALEQRGRHARHLEPSLFEGRTGQQLHPEMLTQRAPLLDDPSSGHNCLLCRAARPSLFVRPHRGPPFAVGQGQNLNFPLVQNLYW